MIHRSASPPTAPHEVDAAISPRCHRRPVGTLLLALPGRLEIERAVVRCSCRAAPIPVVRKREQVAKHGIRTRPTAQWRCNLKRRPGFRDRFKVLLDNRLPTLSVTAGFSLPGQTSSDAGVTSLRRAPLALCRFCDTLDGVSVRPTRPGSSTAAGHTKVAGVCDSSSGSRRGGNA